MDTHETSPVLQSFMDSRPLGLSRVAIVRKAYAALWGDGHADDVRDALILAADHNDAVLRTAVEQMVADHQAYKAGTYRKPLQRLRILLRFGYVVPVAATAALFPALIKSDLEAMFATVFPLAVVVIAGFAGLLIARSQIDLALDASLKPIRLSDGEVFDPTTEASGVLKMLTSAQGGWA